MGLVDDGARVLRLVGNGSDRSLENVALSLGHGLMLGRRCDSTHADASEATDEPAPNTAQDSHFLGEPRADGENRASSHSRTGCWRPSARVIASGILWHSCCGPAYE